MNIQLPKGVKRILDKLLFNGYEGYIVGGCVRDSIMGKIPNDWDICTSAKPEVMMNIFREFKVIPTGLKHGTLTIVINNQHFEVTTYRIDKEYVDGRHPNKVEFTNSLKEDLNRRDFTINAMAYNNKEGLIDYYDGLSDIHNKTIRCVGNAFDRFNEDYLRMLRAVRFSAQLEYRLRIETFKAIKKLSKNIIHISKERIRDEVNKILLSQKPSKGIQLLEETRLLEYIIPELQECVGFEQKKPHHDEDVFYHTMRVLDNTEKDLILRLAALLHDIAKPQCFSIDRENTGHFYRHHMKGMELAEKILKRLKYDNNTIKTVKQLIKEHMLKYEITTPRAIKRLINRVGKENIDRLFKLQIADIKGSKAPYKFDNINKAKLVCDKILNEKQPLTLKDLDIDGNDLKALGVSQGKDIGRILNKLLDRVLDNPELNKKEILADEVRKLLKE
ncbi:CCA tRNA nucleotidyltransferase [Paramaledivibacter caminithermalis]|uniref:tRNA nucleotidyltransferase (CCA-adding enzyme) n=1 Tax=Paramaledivibacter caminithermalis (strain DSM 15212 / CIP 107654 / DViRD3) TaxID=1121301 RepID=A0A1M6QUY8_PARC5|nr:CCA tRNA nucleotidyltransferase [Paramaledivibacter caminithermalis]SHK24082.1 tRNA nucleotidyltransferase (CCA-adding enzyme) [Paramaledivibacter caminithermalis DSM 15212]